MKQTLLKGLLCIATAGALGACADDFGSSGSGAENATGKITLATVVDCSLENARSRADESDGSGYFHANLGKDDLKVKLTSTTGTVHEWGNVTEFNEYAKDNTFVVGTYKLEAYYGDENQDGFENPYIYGVADNIKVKENETTDISLSATLANALVEIVFTDDFTNYMTDYSASVHSAGSTAYHEVAKDDNRPVYVRKGKVDIDISFTKPNGKEGRLEALELTAAPRTLYRVTFDVTSDGSGSVETIEVTLDEDLQDAEPVIIDISDEVLLSPAPEITPDGFDPEIPIEIVGGKGAEGNIVFNVMAYGKMKSATLSTSSVSLTNQGWPSEIDLINGDATDISTMKGLGLDFLGFNKPDKLAMVDLTKVLPNIDYSANGNDTSEFTLVVTDQQGKKSEPVTLTVKLLPIVLSLNKDEYGMSDPSYYMGETTVEFDIYYNGDPANINLQYLHRGTGRFIPMKNPVLTPYADKPFIYRATGEIEATSEAVKVKAIANGKSDELEITPVTQVFHNSKSEINAFAKYVYIPVTAGDEDLTSLISDVKVELQKADGEYAEFTPAERNAANGYLKVEGLEPGAAYNVKIKNPNRTTEKATIRTFTTEDATQLENGDMEDWMIVDGFTKYYNIQYPGKSIDSAIWGTMNLLTTSEGAANSLLNPKPGAAYRASSGTCQTTDKNSGEYAAIISTLGWGGANDANGSVNTNVCKNLTVGELYLGHYDSDNRSAKYDGINFSSRPSTLTFYYKYTAKNASDYGTAEIILKGSKNVEIVNLSTKLEATTEYKPVTLDLNDDYGYDTPTVQNIIVRFKSSGNEECWTINSDNLTSPGNASLLNDYRRSYRYVGSELYIDDIVLNY